MDNFDQPRGAPNVPLDLRRSRRSNLASVFRRRTWVPLTVVLSVLGIVHILESLVGRARIMWNSNMYDPAMADWSKPGFLGVNLETYSTRDVTPIPCHSHNDYRRRVPLYDAISWGCTSVEADLWLFNEELYVSHDVSTLNHNSTFQNMYIEPLVHLLDKRNLPSLSGDAGKNGIFETDAQQTLVLLIDFKQSEEEMFDVIQRQLQILRIKNYLSYWDGQQFISGPITIVLTGSAPFERILEMGDCRDVFYDAPLHALWERPEDPTTPVTANPDTETELYAADPSLLEVDNASKSLFGADESTSSSTALFNISNSYFASTNFAAAVGIVWRGHLSPKQMDIIRGQIRGAKLIGLKSRYWGVPTWPVSLRNHVWHVLTKEGADVLNVDDLKAAAVTNWQNVFHGWWI